MFQLQLFNWDWLTTFSLFGISVLSGNLIEEFLLIIQRGIASYKLKLEKWIVIYCILNIYGTNEKDGQWYG